MADPTAPAVPAAAYPDPIPHILPFGSIATLSGASGVGKTAFLAGMLAALQRGEPFCGHVTHTPAAIGVLACDRPWRDHNAWFQKAGCGDLPHYSLRDVDYDWNALRDWRHIPKIFGQLVDLIHLPPGSLLVVDPLPLFIPGRLIDYKDVAIGLGQLDQQLKPRQLTMVGIFHVSKQKSNKNDRYLRPQDRILGSSALIGYSETAFYLLSPDEAEASAYEFGMISHQLPAQTFQFQRDTNGLFVPYHVLDGAHEEENAYALLPTDAQQTIAVSIWLAQIQQQCSCSERSAYRLINRLRSAGRVMKVGKSLYRRVLPS